MDQDIARMCDIVKRFPCTNPALELYFLLNSEVRLWGLGKPIRLPVQVLEQRNLKQARKAKSYSIRIKQADGSAIIFSEPTTVSVNAIIFSVTIIDLQNLIRRIAQNSQLNSAAVVEGVELGGHLDLWINGNTLSRDQVMQVIDERLMKTNGLDTWVTIRVVSSPGSIKTERLVIVLDQGVSPKEVSLYNSDGDMLSSGPETLTSSIDLYISELFALYSSAREITVVDSVTRATLKSRRRRPITRSPPACTLGHDKIEVIMCALKGRKESPSCSTMVRCLCSKHLSFPFTVQMFYDSISKALGDISMKRGDCPMCCASPDLKSKKPLVRFTEEVDWTLGPDHDWSDFQFRGMLFEMFPDAWVAVENKVYGGKDVVASLQARDMLARAIANCCRFKPEEILTSNDLRPWPLYEMALSRTYGRRAYPAAMDYLDMALGCIFLKERKDKFEESSPSIITRILISSTQLIPSGDCLLDDTKPTRPLSRTKSHIVGCLVSFESPRLRVLAELLRTWASVEWHGDVASYLSSIFNEEFSKGVLGYYFNSDRTTGVQVETFEESLHVIKISERCPQRKKVDAKTKAIAERGVIQKGM
ncbi:hypothetical protein FGB62_166g034 [Gracilaria domingensis]|nr:hypothetical protein FGB62_166g034 [Gracilaria domingensis]